MNKQKKNPIEAMDFEAALARLEALVLTLESKDIPLQESLKLYEEGVGLSRICHQALSAAEQKVEFLSSDDLPGQSLDDTQQEP